MHEHFFRKIVGAVDSPLYVTDIDGTIRYVNSAFERLTGYGFEEVLNQKSSVLRSGEMPLSYYKNLWGTILAGKTWKEEIINQRKDGGIYTVLQSISPLYDEKGNIEYFIAVQYDITREKELQDERQIFFDVSVDLFFIADAEGYFSQINKAWSTILGWGQQELSNKLLFNLIHPEDKDDFLVQYKQLQNKGDIVSIDCRVLKYEVAKERQEYRWVSWRLYYDENKTLFYGSGRDIQKRVEMEQEIRKVSVTDALTGIYNRLKFDTVLNEEIAKTKRYKIPLSLFILDIDFFKTINDTYGHNNGDEVLKTLCSIITEEIRDPDLFARWGGEEFVVLCPHTELKEALSLAERVRQKTESHSFSVDTKVTVSIGVAMFLPETDNADSFLQRADEALYRAKREGRNLVRSSG